MAEVRRRKGEEERDADFEKDYQAAADKEHLEQQSQNSAADSTDDHVSVVLIILALIELILAYHSILSPVFINELSTSKKNRPIFNRTCR